jgi:3'-phosphoadenosine 5'-phosphosulfate sulfotransferase (PAPS reductase)/FAD synthetase
MTVVAFSGGKDSTAMALLMAERGEAFSLLFTPAGDEPVDLFAHVYAVAASIGREVIEPPNKPLDFWIDFHQALPNWRMRWCTRQIKIQPCIDWLTEHPGTTLCVGLRADEEARQGIYGDHATYRYPLREEGWSEADVLVYLARRGVAVPRRTNCELCYGQRLSEWWELWKTNPDKWAKGEQREAEIGHTFRSEGRDSWPAALSDLRVKFEHGEVPRDVELNYSLFEEAQPVCRACTL